MKDPTRVAAGKLGGRPRRYDLAGMKIGQSALLEWKVDFNGNRLKQQGAVHQGVRREELRLGVKFARVGRPTGLLVTRIA